MFIFVAIHGLLMETFRDDVALNAILYVARKMGERKDIHKICKILYFADQAHLSRYGRNITGDTYIAMKYGPVPSHIYDLFKAVRNFSGAEDFKTSYFYFSCSDPYLLIPVKEADLDYLSPSDIECLDEAIDKCRDKDFIALTDFSHGSAWKNTELNHEMTTEDILHEAGAEAEYIAYISEKLKTEAALS